MLTSHTDGDSIAIIHDDTNPITISFTFGGSEASSMSSISYTPENANFITLEPENNDESTRAITITPSANTSTVPRTATITLITTEHEGTPDSVSLTIVQAAAPKIILLFLPNGFTIPIAHNNTDSRTINFTLGGSATSSMSSISYVPEHANFITLEPENNDESTRAITLTPTANTTAEPRTATITLITAEHEGTPDSIFLTIMQGAAPVLELISGDISIAHDATHAIPIFTVGGSATGWRSTITYTPRDVDFITLSDEESTDQPNGMTIMATPTVNTRGDRTATITLRTTGHVGTPVRRTLTITQAAAPTLMLTSHTDGDSIAIIHDDTNPITISFTFGGSEASSMSSISYTPENANFITLEPENNDESTRAITITPSANTSTVPRTATITLITTEHEGTPDSVSLTIVQAAAPKIILLFLPNGFTIPIAHNNTDSRTINFTLGGSATSSMSSISYVPENANFITLEPENNDESTRAITLTPTANTTAEPRTATITLITAEHAGTPDSIFLTIMQGAAPVLELISGDISIAHDATHAIPIFTVGGSATGWRSTITYTPRDVDFITLSDEESTDQPNGMTIMATPTVNTRGDRTATITLRTTGHVGTPVRRTLTITQAAAPTLMLTDHTDGDSIAIAHNNTDPITIDFTLGGSATSSMSTISYMPENANFITLEPENNDESTRTITITPSANTSAEPRTATITLRTTGHEGTPNSVSLTITQDGAESPLGVAPSKPFTLYPNPTKGTLTIEGVTRYLQMYIYDLVGREVMTYSLTPSKKTVDVSDLPSGMYVVTLQGEGKTWKEVLMKR